MLISTTDINQLASSAISERIDGPAGTFFRRTFNMRLQTGGTPDALEVDPDATAFEAIFSSQIYNVLDAGSPIPATARQVDENTVRIELDRPWRIACVKLISNFGNLFSWEGSVDHLRSYTAVPDHMVIAEDTADVYQQLPWQQMVSFRLLRVDGDAIAEEPAATVSSGASLAGDFVASAFAIRAIDNNKVPIGLRVSDLSAVEVETFPTGPRVGICAPAAAPGDMTPAGFFWIVPGQVADAARYDAVNAQAGAAFAGALQRHVKERLEQLAGSALANGEPRNVPPYLDVALVIDSDAPCQAEIDLTVGYGLVRNTFVLPENLQTTGEKQVLRFQAEATTPQRLSVLLPAGALITQSVLEMDASFGSPPAAPAGQGLLPIPAGLNSGVHLEINRWAAQPVMLGESLSLTEIALGVMGLESGTELLVVLQADHAGFPGGDELAEQRIRLSSTGQRHYARLPLDRAISLAATKYWLLAKTLNGSAVWLTRTLSQSGMVLAQTTASGGVASKITQLDGIQSYFAFFSRNPRSSKAGAPVTLQVGDRPVRLSTAANGRLLADATDLTAALNAYTPGADGLTTEAGTAIAMEFAAASKGILTVYAPHLTYGFGSA